MKMERSIRLVFSSIFFSLQLHVFTKRVEDEEMCALFTSVSSYFPSSEVHFCLHIQYGWFASIMPHTALPFAMALEIAQWTRWLAGCFLILLCRFLFFCCVQLQWKSYPFITIAFARKI